MKFGYETQGATTYLVCELDAAEIMDNLSLGMLTNNHINGLAPVLYTEMNGQRFLKFNISAKVTADQFFGSSMNKQRLLKAFQNILNGFCSAEDYMINPGCFSAKPEHVFLNVSNCETALICIPVENGGDINQEALSLFKKILFSANFAPGEDPTYLTQLIGYINSGSFTIYGMKDVVDKLLTGENADDVQNVPPQPAEQPVKPTLDFNGTISIEQMPDLMGQKRAEKEESKAAAPVVNLNQTTGGTGVGPVPTQIPPVQANPVQRPPIQQPAQMRPPVAPPAAQPPQQKNTAPTPPPVQRPPMAPPPVQRPPMAQPPVPPKNAAPVRPQNGPGFAIPGQNGGYAGRQPVAQPPRQSAPVQQPVQQPVKAQNADQKSMSFFGLLAHYNKDNAAAYKAQKEAKKAQKAAAKPASAPKQSGKAAKQSAGMPPVPNAQAPGYPPVQNMQGGVPGQMNYVMPQSRAAVQSVPVQNSFNETTVLSSFVGETTVLSGNPVASSPALIRVKTGERIEINKPVFRIGKEKSYVDCFIGDNTAISRSHANVITENGEYFVEDTNSTNHTYLNGALLTSNVRTKLTNGDKVRLANEDFIFTI